MLVDTAGVTPTIDGVLPVLPWWRSAHRLPGASSWWDRIGVVGGYWTNLDPDQGAAQQPDNSGARCAAWAETGSADVTVAVTWPGTTDTGSAGPMACIAPDADEFGLSFTLEPIYGGVWVLWEMGRQPDDLTLIATSTAISHTPGTPRLLSMTVTGSVVTCRVDGAVLFVEDIPEPLQGSTLHGAAVDVNAVAGRPANLPALVADLTITT